MQKQYKQSKTKYSKIEACCMAAVVRIRVCGLGLLWPRENVRSRVWRERYAQLWRYIRPA